MTAEQIVTFWQKAGPARWFTKDAGFDGTLAVRIGVALQQARRGAFDQWGETPQGALGLVILLDQVSRNINRGSSLAFAADARAFALARRAIALGFHQRFVPALAQWFIMPFEHAEDIDAQARAVSLFITMGQHDMAYWARVHHDIIARFGRFPHRNAILGRASTPDELAFLRSGGFAG